MSWSLRGYLAGLVVLFVLATGGVAVSGWRQARTDALTAARQDADFGARLATTELGADLETLRSTVTQLATKPDIARAFTDPQSCQLSLNLSGIVQAHIEVLRGDGSVVCSSRAAGTGGRGYAGAGWLPGALRAPVFVAPVTDPVTGMPAVLTAVPVPGRGVMAGFAGLDTLGPALSTLFGGPRHLEFLVTSADGKTILSRSPDPERFVGASLSGTPFAQAAEGVERPDVTGVARLYGAGEVAGVGWRVYAGADRADALVAARRLAQRQLVGLLLGLTLALVVTFVVYRRITRPIHLLSAAVRAQGAAPGTGAAPVPVAGPAEVAGLAEDVNRLIAAVEHGLAERRDAEDATREMERSYHQLFDHNPFPMYVYDERTSAVLEVKDTAATHYGYRREEMLDLRVQDLQAPGPATESEPVAGEGDTIRHITKDGSLMEVRLTSHVLNFRGTDARCAVIEDITEKEELERRLRQSQRLESLGRLAGGVAHDFNNLLGIILGYASFIDEEVSAATETDARWRPVCEDLTQVLQAVDRATALTRQLLSFARRETVRPCVLQLNTVITKVEHLLRRTLGEDIEVTTSLAPDLAMLKADRGQLEQMLVNLAVNARDAMPAGGTLAFDTDNLDADEQYVTRHHGARTGPHVRLRVSDTGTGMSQDTIDHAFEPFFTTKPQDKGTGLGLATIYGIVTQAGGHIHITSTLDVGTTITAILPATDEPEAPEDLPATATRRGRGETVLLVEDEESLRTLTERILTDNGYQVITAAGGDEAIDLAAHLPADTIDILLTDVVMPHMPGHELARNMRITQPNLPVIYTSGYPHPTLASNDTINPPATLLNKPTSPTALLTAIRCALDQGQPTDQQMASEPG